MTANNQWERFKERLIIDRASGCALDTSRLNYDAAYLARMEPAMQAAFDEMEALEAGAIANPDEQRMVGHYWLRSPERSPSAQIREAILAMHVSIEEFAKKIHDGSLRGSTGAPFKRALIVGIGGSALGPQFVSQALASSRNRITLSFFDNTDPDGMGRELAEIGDLSSTLVVVISKSGGTKETRNGQLVAKAAFTALGLEYRKHFVAVTGEGSELDTTARNEGWLARFPMWDWVGGRTSELSAVGLLPMALQGVELDSVLRGAAMMDHLGRERRTQSNPAAMMALGWYHCGCGKGAKDMVVLPYNDRLELFSRYLQQLVMESLGKEHDRAGAVVNQGLSVYGNKGSTDQHAYVQQLRDGVPNFFAVFIEVLRDSTPRTTPVASSTPFKAWELEVEPGITSGDYLSGFYLGTRQALYEKGRESITVTIPEVNESTVGMLIALFERAVGLYAALVNINAYHQPGVEAGKKAAAAVLELQRSIMTVLREQPQQALSVEQLAMRLGDPRVEEIFKITQHLAANGRVRVLAGGGIFEDRYAAVVTSHTAGTRC
jgi:glucose-6-phosphate isomerase